MGLGENIDVKTFRKKLKTLKNVKKRNKNF